MPKIQVITDDGELVAEFDTWPGLPKVKEPVVYTKEQRIERAKRRQRPDSLMGYKAPRAFRCRSAMADEGRDVCLASSHTRDGMLEMVRKMRETQVVLAYFPPTRPDEMWRALVERIGPPPISQQIAVAIQQAEAKEKNKQ